MLPAPICLITLIALNSGPLKPGDHVRSLKVAGLKRTYLVHVPPKQDPKKPAPVVLAFHGAGMDAKMMQGFCGLNRTADENGFVVVYPNGTGFFQTWNAGGLKGQMAKNPVDDVRFTRKLLDDLATVVMVDPKRIYATGMSNGAMMCYRLAAELSDRIAAIAPVAGTMAIDKAKPGRPVPIMHFHGTKDTFVGFNGPGKGAPGFLTFKSVDETMRIWTKINGCAKKPKVMKLQDLKEDGTTVTRKVWAPLKGKSEVTLFVIENGGHTWPGKTFLPTLLGRSTMDISANDLMWGFFQQHSLK